MTHRHPHHHGHESAHHAEDHSHDHGHDPLGNPDDLAAYLERLEGADRAEWQQPDAVIAAMGLREGDRVCEVGPGPGYFTTRLARAVGPKGKVYAIEAEPKILEVLRARLDSAHVTNVEPILAGDGATLPPEPVDRVLVVNTFHHFPHGADYLRALAGKLTKRGEIVVVDFHDGDIPIGPPADHRVSREAFLAAAESAGLKVVREERFLAYQYFIVLSGAQGPTDQAR